MGIIGYNRVMTLNLRWNNLPVAPHLVCGATSPPRLPPSSSYSSPGRGLEASTNLSTLSVLSSVITEEVDFTDKDTSNVSILQNLDDDGFSLNEETKAKAGKRPRDGLDYMAAATSTNVEGFVLHSSRPSQFGLLLKNLDILEESVADSGGQKLEKDILSHLDRLGALETFNTYLTRTLQKNILDFPDVLTESVKDHRKVYRGSVKSTLDLSDVLTERSKEKCMQFVTPRGPVEKIIVRTGKKEQRLNSRERVMKMQRTAASLPSMSQTMEKSVGRPGRKTNSKRTRLKIARNEAEFSRGVKVVLELERICTNLEKATGRAPSLSSWAEAAGLDKKMLQQQLRYGWYCRDELIRSTRSLVLFLARNYKVPEVEWEDLLQAGYMGVLQGAERFDHTRGNKFSTYVRFWIQKELRKTITSSRGIQVPYTVRQDMSRIHSARQTLTSIHGRAPDDREVADFTGYTVARIASVSKYARVVVSIDQNLRNRFTGTYSGKYLDFIPDTSIQSPLEAVMRQRMEQDIDNILTRLGPREREVLVLRYGMDKKRPKSLEEIGQIFQVSKEWVRRLQKKVLMEIRNDEFGKDLIHYVYW